MGELLVYEVVDLTDDETYYTIGIWSDLGQALEMIRGFRNDPDGLEQNGYVDDYCRVVVRARRLNAFSTEGHEVASFVWTQEYNEEADKYVWKMTEEGNDV